MRLIIAFTLGFAVSHAWTYWLESWTYDRAMASFACGVFDRDNVWLGSSEGAVCADLSTSYPASFALDRIISNISRPRLGPQ